MLTYLFQVRHSVSHSSLDFLGVGGVDPIQKGSRSGTSLQILILRGLNHHGSSRAVSDGRRMEDVALIKRVISGDQVLRQRWLVDFLQVAN